MPKDVVTLLSEEDAKKYAGQYVCVARFGSKDVVSAAVVPAVAYLDAKNKGFSDPVIFYVPCPDEIFIFHRETATYDRTHPKF